MKDFPYDAFAFLTKVKDGAVIADRLDILAAIKQLTTDQILSTPWLQSLLPSAHNPTFLKLSLPQKNYLSNQYDPMKLLLEQVQTNPAQTRVLVDEFRNKYGLHRLLEHEVFSVLIKNYTPDQSATENKYRSPFKN